MFFRQVLHEDLGCASYVVGDGGEAAVIDPKWEIEDYLRLAEKHGFAVTHILETHNHADHVSEGQAREGDRGDHPRPRGRGRRVPARAAGGRRPGGRRERFDHGPRHARPSA